RLALVRLQVVEFRLPRPLREVLPDGLPVPRDHRLLTAVAGELPVQQVVRLLLPQTAQCRPEADPVEVTGNLCARDIAERRQHVREVEPTLRRRSRLNLPRPARDE